MEIREQILHLFSDDSPFSFEDVAISVFRYQATHNLTYKAYLNAIGVNVEYIKCLEQIPLAPISFFKNHSITSGQWNTERIFLSSGSGGDRSAHHIKDLEWYEDISLKIIGQRGYDIANTTVLALLPSYLENGDSSLVHMVSHFSKLSQTNEAFYLYNFTDLYHRLMNLLSQSVQPILLIGVTFALIDFANTYKIDSDQLRICFTGGMKNRRREMTFDEVKQQLGDGFPSSRIFSEYGMTELLSQSYSDETGYFIMPPSCRIIIKEINDPFSACKIGKTGQVGLIDLANIDTLSFILSDDLGRLIDRDHFEILGRLTNSDLRGCTLLYNPS